EIRTRSSRTETARRRLLRSSDRLGPESAKQDSQRRASGARARSPIRPCRGGRRQKLDCQGSRFYYVGADSMSPTAQCKKVRIGRRLFGLLTRPLTEAFYLDGAGTAVPNI